MLRLVKGGEATVSTLTNKSDFNQLSRVQTRAVSAGLVLICKKRAFDLADGNDIRVGFTVSKKSTGNAVQRNFVKRRFRALVQEVFPELALPGYDYVIVARKAASKRGFDKLRKDMRFCLHNLEKQLKP